MYTTPISFTVIERRVLQMVHSVQLINGVETASGEVIRNFRTPPSFARVLEGVMEITYKGETFIIPLSNIKAWVIKPEPEIISVEKVSSSPKKRKTRKVRRK